MSDIFDETEENLRADQWVNIVKNTLPWVGGVAAVALACALGVWGYQSYQKSEASKASIAFETGIDALDKNDRGTAKAQFEAVEKMNNSAYKAMALQQLAGMAVEDGNTDLAVKDLDAAAKESHNVLISDQATYKAALLLLDTASLADIQARLAPLTKEGRPLAGLAKEAIAMSKLKNNDLKGARSDLQILSVTLGTPDGVKQRAAAFVAAIDSGAIKTAQDLLKQPEAKLPATPQSLLGGGAQGMPSDPAQGAPAQ